MSSNTRLLIPALSVAIAAVAVIAPGDIGDFAVLGWALATTLLLWRAARRHQGDTRRFLNRLVVSAALVSTGIVVRGIHGELIGVESPIPSPAELFHVPGYLLFLVAAVQVHRARAPRPSPDAWLDAGAVVTAVVMILWVTFYGDYLLGDSIPIDVRLINGGYNLIVLAIFAVYVRITATPGQRSAVYYLLGGAGFAFFVVDVSASYSLIRNQGVWLTVALSPLVYGLLLTAARHPAADQLLRTDPDAEVSIGPLRLGILGAAIGSPTLVLIFGRDQSATSLGVLIVLSAVLSVLVIIRVVRLLADQRDTALLDRRAVDELARLTTEDSVDAIVAGLPDALRTVSGDPVRYVHPGPEQDRKDQTVFTLPASLARRGPSAVAVRTQQATVSPAKRRVVDSMLRQVGLLVDSLEGREAQAARRSEAEANRRVAASERRFRSLVDNAADLIMVVEADGTVAFVSGAIERLLGLRAADLTGRHLIDSVHSDDREEFRSDFQRSMANRPGTWEANELRFTGADGVVRLLDYRMTNLLDVADVEGIVINAADVTEKRRLERDLLDARVTDRLTLLPNRAGFLDDVATEARRAQINHSTFAVAVMNIRDFKALNDALSPEVADRLLIAYAGRLREAVRRDDVIARLGGDEFAVLVRSVEGSDDAVAVVERLVASSSEPFDIDARRIDLRVDAGLLVADNRPRPAAEAAETVLREAGIALSEAKHQPFGAGVVVFEAAMAERVAERHELRSGIGTGLENDEFRLVYQPIVDLHTGRIRSVEALARWTHPRLGPVSPLTFIEIAEQSDQINTLGDWVIRTACRQLRSWAAMGIEGVRVAVNVSVHQLRQRDVVDRVLDIVRSVGVDPSLLTIEVTESVLIEDSEVVAGRLQRLRRAGFVVAIDDFGTGYSSLGYVQQFEFDVLKIDKSFVDPLTDEQRPKDREVVRSIIALAHGLDVRTVAEGIDDPTQLATLRELGCDDAQGFLLHRPLEVVDCTEILAAQAAEVAAGGRAVSDGVG